MSEVTRLIESIRHGRDQAPAARVRRASEAAADLVGSRRLGFMGFDLALAIRHFFREGRSGEADAAA